VRNFFQKIPYITAIVVVFSAVVSCEKDFTDIGSNVIGNTAFSTGSMLLDVQLENSPVTKLVTSDFIISDKPEYLLGVHASDDYEKIEASIISQIAINSDLQLPFHSDTTTVVTTIDTVFVKMPYRVVLNSEGTAYELDSIIGNQSQPFNLNIYQSSTYLNSLDPSDPSKLNSYSSDDVFEKKMPLTALNDPIDFQFTPKATDTVIVKRWLSDQKLSRKDTVIYTSSSSSLIPLPFGFIPLKKEVINELFFKKIWVCRICFSRSV